MSIDPMSTTPAQPRKSQAMQDFENLIERRVNEATPEDREKVAALTDPQGAVRIDAVSPNVAAVLFAEHNHHNRNFSLRKAQSYCDVMRRGEWRVTHQGLAFYKDGKIADGQHRLATVAESGTDQVFVMFPNFENGAVDAIDIGRARSAGDAVQLLGIEQAETPLIALLRFPEPPLAFMGNGKCGS